MLDVVGNARFTSNVLFPSFAVTTSIYAGLASPNASFLSWGDGSGWKFGLQGNSARTTNVLTLVDTGNIGISCNSPLCTLDVTVPLNGIGMRFQNSSAHGMCSFSAQGALSSGSYTFSNANISNIALLIGGFHLQNTTYWADFVTYFDGSHVYNNLSYTSSGGFNLTSSAANQLIFTFAGLGSTNYSFSATIYYTLY